MLTALGFDLLLSFMLLYEMAPMKLQTHDVLYFYFHALTCLVLLSILLFLVVFSSEFFPPLDIAREVVWQYSNSSVSSSSVTEDLFLRLMQCAQAYQCSFYGKIMDVLTLLEFCS